MQHFGNVDNFNMTDYSHVTVKFLLTLIIWLKKLQFLSINYLKIT